MLADLLAGWLAGFLASFDGVLGYLAKCAHTIQRKLQPNPYQTYRTCIKIHCIEFCSRFIGGAQADQHQSADYSGS